MKSPETVSWKDLTREQILKAKIPEHAFKQVKELEPLTLRDHQTRSKLEDIWKAIENFIGHSGLRLKKIKTNDIPKAIKSISKLHFNQTNNSLDP